MYLLLGKHEKRLARSAMFNRWLDLRISHVHFAAPWLHRSLATTVTSLELIAAGLGLFPVAVLVFAASIDDNPGARS